jgi:signal transduction histidine kinase
METLIDDVLTLARAGETVGELEVVDLVGMISGCWQNVDTKSAEVLAETDTDLRADTSRLSELFENLFRNAVEQGGDDVTVTIGELDHGFYIEDDGPGIPEADREKVFEAGYSSREEGTGFGLSIVKEIVEAHDWEIQLIEGTEGGARFEINGIDVVNN